ncbi:Thymocyte nuclear protein 1 [Strongyloides ratti]|uniref:Thymocyte nuclear protein 1 n=1 Tax=Strongyloides ratti TaxID=34506 RepID=A0A090KV07_STRRB|nr:Thymocyte nuclear protein 1 [Strongyloides ratti]CEF61221.1 Thymocyte nuclear protein 1 [Strongyloides ratti]
MKRKSQKSDETSTNITKTCDRSFWLMKAEPETRIVRGVDVKFTIDDLEKCKISTWDGVRNHLAKKYMSSMKVDDLAFMYQSNCKNPGVTGIMRIVRSKYQDPSASDPAHPYYDEKVGKGIRENKWVAVDVEFVEKFKNIVLLKDIKSNILLSNMALLKQSRLSVSPVSKEEWDTIIKMTKKNELKQ